MSKDGMDYELSKNIKKPNGKQVLLKEVDRLSTTTIMWFLVRRHKVGILATWAVIATALYIFPPLPDLLFGLLGH